MFDSIKKVFGLNKSNRAEEPTTMLQVKNAEKRRQSDATKTNKKPYKDILLNNKTSKIDKAKPRLNITKKDINNITLVENNTSKNAGVRKKPTSQFSGFGENFKTSEVRNKLQDNLKKFDSICTDFEYMCAPESPYMANQAYDDLVKEGNALSEKIDEMLISYGEQKKSTPLNLNEKERESERIGSNFKEALDIKADIKEKIEHAYELISEKFPANEKNKETVEDFDTKAKGIEQELEAYKELTTPNEKKSTEEPRQSSDVLDTASDIKNDIIEKFKNLIEKIRNHKDKFDKSDLVNIIKMDKICSRLNSKIDHAERAMSKFALNHQVFRKNYDAKYSDRIETLKQRVITCRKILNEGKKFSEAGLHEWIFLSRSIINEAGKLKAEIDNENKKAGLSIKKSEADSVKLNKDEKRIMQEQTEKLQSFSNDLENMVMEANKDYTDFQYKVLNELSIPPSELSKLEEKVENYFDKTAA